MRRLAQFVRLRASVRLASRVCLSASRVCVHLSRVRLASVCVCSRQGFRMRASASCASVVLSRVCRLVSRLSRVCVRLASRVCLASVVLSRVCLASACVGRLVSRLSRVGRLVSRLSVSPCECLRGLAHFMRRSSFKEFKRFLLSSYYLIMSQCQSIHPIT